MDGADEINTLERTTEMEESILRGMLDHLPSIASKVVRVFISSTFSDTVKERNALMEDVYPRLKDFCRSLGLEFQVVDMRWGVREEAQDDHMTSALCMREIIKCRNLSAGPTFVAFLGQKYGYRPFPAVISADEFQAILGTLETANKDISLFNTWFRVDENESPRMYRLQTISSVFQNYINVEDAALREEDRKQWWEVFAQLQTLLREGAKMAYRLGILTAKQAEKYFISVTEEEVYHGLLADPNKTRQLVINRNITDLHSHLQSKRAAKFIDIHPGGGIDKEASDLLTEMRDVKVPEALQMDDRVLSYTVRWATEEGIDEFVHRDYLRSLCKDFYDSMVKLIEKHQQSRLSADNDDTRTLYLEVLQHATMCKSRCDIFLGRGEILKDVQAYLEVGHEEGGEASKHPLVVHGESGSGKTSILAMAAMMCSKISEASPVIILRFLGTTPLSTNIYNVLLSICKQISHVYNRDIQSIPDDFNKLVMYFKDLLKAATSDQPLVLILDSLDQLSSNYNAYTLSWLPWKLPPHVHMVISVLTKKHGLLKKIRANISHAGNFLEIPALGEELGYDIVRLWLKVAGRKLTSQQNEVVQEAFNQCSLPLYTKLVFEEVQKWPSYLSDERLTLPPTVQGMINMLLEKLEVQHGRVLVSQALSYITASRNGLSEAELEDLLSLDDAVLDEVFTFWVPPIRRLPPLLWTRIHEDLGNYLVSREANGVTVLAWYHRQFIEVAHERYLQNKSFKKQIHSMLADYFLGKWAGKEKPFKYSVFLAQRLGLQSPEGRADRKVSAQPVSWVGPTGSTHFNCRKLSEVPYNLYYSGRLEEMWKLTIFNYHWINASVKAGSLPEMLSDISLARNASMDSKFGLLFSALKMAGSSLIRLPQTVGPELIARLKGYTRTNPEIGNLVKQCETSAVSECALLPLYQCFDTPVEALVSCLEGHAKRVRDLAFSHDSSQLYSISEDGYVCIWDVPTGERLHSVDITHLPVNRHSELHVTRKGVVCELYTEGSPLLVMNPADGLIQLSIGKRQPGFKHDTIACKNLAIREGEVINIKEGRITKVLEFLSGKTEFVVLALTHDERYIIAGEKEATRMYSIATGEPCLEIPHQQIPSKIAVTKDDTIVAIGYAVSCEVRVVNIDMESPKFGKRLFHFDYKKDFPDYQFQEGGLYCQEVSEMVLSNNCERVAVNIKYVHVFVLSLLEREVVMLDSPADVNNITNICFSSDDKYLVSMTDTQLCVWDVDNGDLISSKELSGSSAVVCAAPSSNILASVTATDNVINIWNLDKLEESARTSTLMYENPVDTVLVSPQHQLALIKTYKRLDSHKGYHYVDHFGLDVWELNSFQRQTFLPFGHHGLVTHTQMSRDGNVLVLCTTNQERSHIYVVEVQSGSLSCHFTVSKASAVQISPSGSYVMVECSKDGKKTEIGVYNAQYGTVVHTMSDSHSGTFTLDCQYALWLHAQHIVIFSLIQRTRSKLPITVSATSIQVIPNYHDYTVVTERRKRSSKAQVISLSTRTKLGSLKSVALEGLVDFSKNGQVAVDGLLQVFDLQNFALKTRCVPSETLEGKEISLVRLTHSGCHVLWADTQPVHCIKAFHIETQHLTATVSTHSAVLSLDLVDAGFKVLAGCANGHFLAFGLHTKDTCAPQDTYRSLSPDEEQVQNSAQSGPSKWALMRLASVNAADIDPLFKQPDQDISERTKLPRCSKQTCQTMRENAKCVRTLSLTGPTENSSGANVEPSSGGTADAATKKSSTCTIV